MSTITRETADFLENELNWLSTLIETRIKQHFGQECEYKSIIEVPRSTLPGENHPYSRIISQFADDDFSERAVLILALAPTLRPELLDSFFLTNKNTERIFSEFGGVSLEKTGGFIPTIETALFLLSTTDFQDRLETMNRLMQLMSKDHFLQKEGIIQFAPSTSDHPPLANTLNITLDGLNKLLFN